jgi:hypothetical protein
MSLDRSQAHSLSSSAQSFTSTENLRRGKNDSNYRILPKEFTKLNLISAMSKSSRLPSNY